MKKLMIFTACLTSLMLYGGLATAAVSFGENTFFSWRFFLGSGAYLLALWLRSSVFVGELREYSNRAHGVGLLITGVFILISGASMIYDLEIYSCIGVLLAPLGLLMSGISIGYISKRLSPTWVQDIRWE